MATVRTTVLAVLAAVTFALSACSDDEPGESDAAANGELVDETTAHVEVVVAASEDGTNIFELTLTDDGWLISGEVLADTTPSPTASPEG